MLIGVVHETPQSEQSFRLHSISVSGFEGPLDLLLNLIEAEKLDVNQISLAAVTDQYITRLKEIERLPPEHLADFLVVAATLLLLKSRRLFPRLALTEEEEDRVASLEEQLREYRRFRNAGKELVRLWDRDRPLRSRQSFLGVVEAFYPPPGFRGSDLRRAMGVVVANLPQFEQLTEDIVKRVVSLEERIRGIQERIAAEAQVTFETLARSASSKVEVIVSFLALLELVKQRAIVAVQTRAFDDIVVRRGT